MAGCGEITSRQNHGAHNGPQGDDLIAMEWKDHGSPEHPSAASNSQLCAPLSQVLYTVRTARTNDRLHSKSRPAGPTTRSGSAVGTQYGKVGRRQQRDDAAGTVGVSLESGRLYSPARCRVSAGTEKEARTQKSSIYRPRLGPRYQIDPDFLPLPTSNAVEGDSSSRSESTDVPRPGPDEGALVFDRTVAFGPDGQVTLAAAALVQWWSSAADGSEGVAAETVFAALMRSGGDAASAAVSLILGAPSHVRAKIGELQPVQRHAGHPTAHRDLTAVAESQELAEATIKEICVTRGSLVMDDVIIKAVDWEVDEKLHNKPKIHDKVGKWPGWSEYMSLEVQLKHQTGGYLDCKSQHDNETMSAGLERTTTQKKAMKVAALRVHQGSTVSTGICRSNKRIAPVQLEDSRVVEGVCIQHQDAQGLGKEGVQSQPAERCSNPCSLLARNLFQGTGIEAAPFWLVRAANGSLWQPTASGSSACIGGGLLDAFFPTASESAAANTKASDVATEKVSGLAGGRRQGARNRICRRALMVDAAASPKEKFRHAAGRPKPLRQRPVQGSRARKILALAHCGKHRCKTVSLGQEKRDSQEARPPSSSSSLCSPPPSPASKAHPSSQTFPAVNLCLDYLLSKKDITSKVGQRWRQESVFTTAAKDSQAEEMPNVMLTTVLADMGMRCGSCTGATASLLNKKESEEEAADDQHTVAATAAAAEAAALAAEAEEAAAVALAAEAEGSGTAARAVSAAELHENTASLQGSAVVNQAVVTVKAEDADLVCDITTAAQYVQPCKRPRLAAEVCGGASYSRQTRRQVTLSTAACSDVVAEASACPTKFNGSCGESDTMTMISDSDDEGAVSGFGGSGRDRSTPDCGKSQAGGFSRSSADGNINPAVTKSAQRIAYKWAADVTYCGTVVSSRPVQQYKGRQIRAGQWHRVLWDDGERSQANLDSAFQVGAKTLRASAPGCWAFLQ